MLSAFAALAPQHHGAHTLLTGLLDQSALYGVLAEIEALGLDLLELRKLTQTANHRNHYELRHRTAEPISCGRPCMRWFRPACAIALDRAIRPAGYDHLSVGVRCSDRVQLGDGVGGRVRAAPTMFSRRWATDEVPGSALCFGECCSSQDWATAVGVAPSRSATRSSTSDCSGEKPPSGKYGTYAMCCSAVAASTAASALLAML